MSCTGCEVLVESAVEPLPTVTFVAADADRDTLDVGYDERLPEGLGDAIADYGFDLGDRIERI